MGLIHLAGCVVIDDYVETDGSLHRDNVLVVKARIGQPSAEVRSG